MGESEQLKRQILSQTAETHERFVELMNERLRDADTEDIERYFGLLAALVAKLEAEEKSLRDVAQEMVGEFAATLITELGS